MNQKIKCFRLSSGEEIIGVVNLEINNKLLMVINPNTITYIPNPDTGRLMLMLVPFMPYVQEKEYTFNMDQIIVYTDAPEVLANSYLELISGRQEQQEGPLH